MHTGRTIALFVALGAIVGVAIASAVVPPMLVWYNEPGSISPDKVQTVCNLPEVIRYTTNRLIRGQLIGAAIGAALFFVIGLVVARRRPATAAPA